MMKKEQKNITIIGTGAYGTVLANVLTDNDHNVIMYGIENKEVNDINDDHLNRHFFADLKINKEIKATTNFGEAVEDAEYIILGIPVVAIKPIIDKINQTVKKPVVIINVAKGLDPETHEILSKSIVKLISPSILKAYAGIYGPSIAKEVLQRKPTCIMAVSNDLGIAQEVQGLFNNEYFVTFADTDVIGAEYAVALKNAVAIASGIFNGLYESDNAKASLITMGLNEIKLFANAKGARIETFLNFAGLADLILTVTSKKSRNYTLGFEIGQADDAEKVLASYPKTVEGVLTCKTIVLDAQANNITLPLFETLYDILYNCKRPSIIINNVFTKAILS
ncbi:NAD(P)H-dependent glycerol-3-phosphate dehydrogenase [Spiroplasma endosymbiont of Polydrusus cervinus]|uniref:NAD(P)H-dependent glycerol-3-phosphate dehydrogenase n=1 Tax=Spiroplasma endosymbiont of Polydrusus cervinus TaxID=3066287 RepID=UPI0030D21806